MLKLIKVCLICVCALLCHACAISPYLGMLGSGVATTVNNKNERESIDKPRRLKIAKANFLVAVEYIRQGEYEKAQEKLFRAKEAEPTYAPTYNALGILYQGIGEPEKAEKNFKRALKLDKAKPGTLNNYGQFLCSQGRLEEAEELFIQAASDPLYRTPEAALTNAGSCALMNGRKKEAIAYFEKALGLNPHVGKALVSMIRFEYEKQNYFAANTYLKRYLEVAPHTPQTLLLGSRIQRRLGDKDLLASYELLLRNKFGDSREARLLGNVNIDKDLLLANNMSSALASPLIYDFAFITEATLLSTTDLISESVN